MDTPSAQGYACTLRLPDRMAALFANLRVQGLPEATCSKLTVTVVVEGGAVICRFGMLADYTMNDNICAITW